MKNSFTIILLLCIQLACSHKPMPENITIKPPGRLEGKWKLISVKQEPGTTHKIISDSIEYYKMLTNKTFTWFTYDKNSGVLRGTAGGTYTLDGEKYIEDIQYIYPYNPSIMSSSIPFLCQLQGNRWVHSGYIENREFDSLLNDYIVLSKYKLEEIWERTE
jgi:hypothetical protein